MRRPIFVGLLVTAVIAVAAPARACIESWGPVPGVDPDVIAHANRAECAIEVGDYATAVAEYRALYGLLGPGERGALVLMNIAGAEERLGHDRAALESYEEAWRELPESLRRDHVGRTLRERERLLRERLSATDSHITGVSLLLGGSASIVAAVITGSIALASYGEAPAGAPFAANVGTIRDLAITTDALWIAGAAVVIASLIVLLHPHADALEISMGNMIVRF